jgi:4'-phosphopantetheinyl transferase EntD
MPVNPARLSNILLGLFPPGVVAAELRGPGNPELLLPGEAAHMGRAVPKRVAEFTAGRLCARRALAEFGIVDFPLEVGADRRPIWPDGMLGSITHTHGYCAAVVAARRCVVALGVDSEVVGEVNEEIWCSICVPQETAWIRSLPRTQQDAAAALIFSTKEAFYKCQYPVTREFLGFHDVSVEAPAWNAAEGEFRVRPLRSIGIEARSPAPLRGRYLFHDEFVTAGMGLAAAQLTAQ